MMDDWMAQADVMILDRQEFFSAGLVSFLQAAHPDWRFAVLDDLDDLLDHAMVSPTAVVLIDLDLPDLGGLPGLATLHAAHPDHSFIGLAGDDNRPSILATLAAGARGYIQRNANPMQFLRGVEAVMAGGVFAPASLTGGIQLDAVRPAPVASDTPDISAIPNLTDRQREVFQLLIEGCPTKTIARRLNLGIGTVKVHLAAIYRTLGASSRLEAVSKVQRTYAMAS